MPARLQKPCKMSDVAHMDGVSEGQKDARQLGGGALVFWEGFGGREGGRLRVSLACLGAVAEDVGGFAV